MTFEELKALDDKERMEIAVSEARAIAVAENLRPIVSNVFVSSNDPGVNSVQPILPIGLTSRLANDEKAQEKLAEKVASEFLRMLREADRNATLQTKTWE